MSDPPSRLRNLLGHLLTTTTTPYPPNTQTPTPPPPKPQTHIHQLSPTFFLPRAASIEPTATAIYHITANSTVLRRSYLEFADRARGLAYHLLKHRLRRIGILCPNTPAFLESIFGIPASGGVCVPVNYRLKPEDVTYILEFASVDAVVVDKEYEGLLTPFRERNPEVKVLVDWDTDATEGELCGAFDEAVLEGLKYDVERGGKGWDGLGGGGCEDENGVIAIPFTSGTTNRPKGVEYTHRGCYLAAVGNVVESGLNMHVGRCKYLWTLPMFHAMGWTFPWAITAVRGTHVCLRKIDYPLIWSLLKQEGITHFNAAPTVNTLLCAATEAERLPNPVHVTVAASPPTAHLFEQMTALNLHPVHVYGMTETYGPITKSYHIPAWDNLPPAEKFANMARQGHGFITSLPIRVVPQEGEASSDSTSTTSTTATSSDPAAYPPKSVRLDGTELGEILFYGNITAPRYHNDPAATAALFHPSGGLRSGDLAVLHPDGSVQIMDRSKDIIISGGENISSVALEGLLSEHPGVLEVGVVGVADSHWGERPKAYVTVKDGAGGTGEAGKLRGEDVVEWARGRENISRFMVPREVQVLGELPKTSTGKIRKNVLREWAKKGREP